VRQILTVSVKHLRYLMHRVSVISRDRLLKL